MIDVPLTTSTTYTLFRLRRACHLSRKQSVMHICTLLSLKMHSLLYHYLRRSNKGKKIVLHWQIFNVYSLESTIRVSPMQLFSFSLLILHLVTWSIKVKIVKIAVEVALVSGKLVPADNHDKLIGHCWATCISLTLNLFDPICVKFLFTRPGVGQPRLWIHMQLFFAFVVALWGLGQKNNIETNNG